MKTLTELFLTFFKIGMFTFGGGYAMISIIENECVEKKKWITHEEMVDLTVIAESTPGPIAINAATYIGFKQADIPGSLMTTAGVALPSFLIIYLIATVLDNFLEIVWVANAFRGIQAGVGLLILSVGLNMLKKMKKRPLFCFLAGLAFVVMLTVNLLSLKFSSIVLMLLCGGISLGLFLAGKRGGKQ